MEQRGYKHLTDRDRLLIAKLRAKKFNITEIARRVGKDKSTVSRELRRNATVETAHDRLFYFRVHQLWTEEELDRYLATQPAEARETKRVWRWADAQQMAEHRAWKASQKRRRKTAKTRKWVTERLHLNWSPEQIAGRSKIDGPESVSHEWVYSFVRRDKKLGGELHHRLRRFGKRKQRFGAREYRAVPPCDRTCIEKRPRIVERRARLGDYEADLIIGYRQSGNVVVVNDRKSRVVSLRRVQTKRVSEVRPQLEAGLEELGNGHTLTVDRGTEFNGHKQLTQNTGIRVFFCHPYSSTERGTVENTNGLVRYYLPKRSSFANLTQERLDEIAALLNNRPRKCLGYLTPNEVHFKTKPLRTLSKRCI
jgi:IS30 family transposase